jgi:hypothetical protein
MNKLFEMSRWGLMLLAVTGLVFIYSCGGDDEEPEPDPIPPGLSYAATTVAVGSTGTIAAAVTGDAATYEITDDGGATFVTINANTGELSVAAESTIGVYSVVVKATNSAGTKDATAEITIGINEDFDPTGKTLLWKYWMNNTEGIVMENLNELPGQGDLPAAIPIPVGWPGGTPFVIDPATEGIEAYFTFPLVQGFLLQVPGDNVCSALDPEERGDTLLIIVNPDLTLSTTCRLKGENTTGSTVEIGTSTISYADGGFVWTLNLTLEGVPVSYPLYNATIADFTDPLDPHFTAPSGTPRTFSSIQGTIDPYTTPTDFLDYLGSLAFPSVDVVLEILE